METLTLSDLLEHGYVEPGENLVFTYKGVPRHATILASGEVKLEDGTIHHSPSGAAKKITGRPMNGWDVWIATRVGARLTVLRTRCQQAQY